MSKLSYKQLLEHEGHDIQIVSSFFFPSVSIHCVSCGEPLYEAVKWKGARISYYRDGFSPEEYSTGYISFLSWLDDLDNYPDTPLANIPYSEFLKVVATDKRLESDITIIEFELIE